MPSEIEYKFIGDYIEGLSKTENPSLTDKALVYNETDGPRYVPANPETLTNVATEADMTADAKLRIKTPTGEKQLPANLVAKKSESVSGIHNLPDKNEGYLVLNDANGTGKFAIKTIFDNFAGEFDPNRDAEHPYLVGEVVIEGGKLYECVTNHAGQWVAEHFARTSAAALFAEVRDVDALALILEKNSEDIESIVDGDHVAVKPFEKISEFEVGNLGSTTGMPSSFTNAIRTKGIVPVDKVNNSTIKFKNDDSTLSVTMFFFDSADNLVDTSIYNNAGVKTGTAYKTMFRLADTYKIKLDADVHHVRFALQKVDQLTYTLDFAENFSLEQTVSALKVNSARAADVALSIDSSVLPDKNEGYLVLNDANGTGKFAIKTIFDNFAGEFDPNRDAEHPYLVGEVVIEGGKLYECVTNHAGQWVAEHFARTSAEALFAKVSDVEKNTEDIERIVDGDHVAVKPFEEISEFEVGNLGSTTGMPSSFTNAIRTKGIVPVDKVNNSTIKFKNDDSTLSVTMFFFDSADNLVDTSIYNNAGVKTGTAYKTMFRLADTYKIKLDADVHHVRFALQKVDQLTYTLDFAENFSLEQTVSALKVNSARTADVAGVADFALAISDSSIIGYNPGTKIEFVGTPECSGIQYVSTVPSFKKGSKGFLFDLFNSGSKSIRMNLGDPTDKCLGFYIHIPQDVQKKVYRLKVKLLDQNQTQLYLNYGFGVGLYTDVDMWGLTKRNTATPNDWMFIKTKELTGNAHYVVLEFDFGSNVPSDASAGKIVIDGVVLADKKIKPTFIFNFDNAYSTLDAGHSNSKAIEVYSAIENAGLKYSICGPHPSASDTELYSLLRSHVEKGILELGMYGGQTSVVTLDDYNDLVASIHDGIDTTVGFNSAIYDESVPEVYGCQFQFWTKKIVRALNECRFDVIRGGVNMGYNAYHFNDIDSSPLLLGSDAFDFQTESDARNWVDEVIAHKTVSLMFAHDFADADRTNLQSSAQAWKWVIGYIGQKKSAGDCLVLTPSEFSKLIRNR